MSIEADLSRQRRGSEPPHAGKRDVLLAVSELVGRKWQPLILFHLHYESMGFADLKDEISGISGKMLAESLETLTEEYGVVERREVSGGMSRVEYSLSPSGETLAPILLALREWGSEHLDPENHA